MQRPLCIGIDAGGSGVRGVLGDGGGELVARIETRPGFRLVGNVERERLREAWLGVLGPLRDASNGRQVVCVHAGLSGISIQGTAEACAAVVKEVFPAASIRSSSDAVVAARGALADRRGVAVVAGTGSIALAGDGAPYRARAGGYGYVLGDEGSGFWLGREALAAALKAMDGRGPPTLLTELIREWVGVGDMRECVPWLYGQPTPALALATLAPVAARAADEQDAVAAGILRQAGTHLADLAVAAARQAWPMLVGLSGDDLAGQRASVSELEVARCGRVWRCGALLHEAFTGHLHGQLPGARPVDPLLPPEAGALLAALNQLDASSAHQRVVAALQRHFS